MNNSFDNLKKEISDLIKNEKYDQILKRLDLFDRINLNHISESTTPKEQTKEKSDFTFEKYLHKSLLDVTLSGICILTTDKHLFVNKAWQNIMGYTDVEAYKMSPLEIIHPDMKEMVKERSNLRLKGEKVPERYDIKVITKDKSVKWIDFTFSGIQLENQMATLGILNDITEMYNTQDALIKSEEKYRELTELSPAAIAIQTTNKILFVNPAWVKISGYSKEEALKMSPIDFVHPDMKELLRKRSDSRIEGEETVNKYDIKIISKDQKIKWLTTSLARIDFDGILSNLAVSVDITDVKDAQQALKESEEKFRKLTELSPAAICIQTTEKFLWANPAWSEIFGYSLDEVLKLGPLDAIHPDMHEIAKKRSNSRLNLEDVTSRYNLKILTKNKKVKWLDVAITVIQFEGQLASLVVSTDVTKQVNAQEALKESEEKYRGLIENLRSEYFFYRHNVDGIFEYVSPSIINVLGYSQEEFLVHYNKYLTDNPINKIADEKTKLAIKGIQQLPYEIEIYNVQNNIHTLEISEIPIIDDDGNVISVEGIAHDITSQKKAEETIKNQIKEIKIHNKEIKAISEEAQAINENLETRIVEINNLNEELKISENKFRTLVENIPGVVYRCLMQEDWEMKFISKEIEAISGYPDTDFINNKVRTFASIIHPDDSNEVISYIRKVIDQDKTFSFEYRIIDKEGTIKWVYEKGQAEFDSNKNVKWLDGVIFDITEQKKADQALQESKKLYEKLVNNQGEALVIVNNENEFVFANPAAHEIFGVPQDKLVGRNLKEFLTEEYIREVGKQTKKRKAGIKNTYELEIQRPDYSKRFILVTASPEYNKENEIIGGFAIFRDITKRKKAENAILKSEKKLREMNAQKDKFFSLIAHDLRSPIGNFVQISELLRSNYEGLSEEQIHEFFENLHNLADRTFTLLENLLMWSRSQLGRLEIDKKEIELYKIVNEVAELYEENFNTKNIQFINELPENLIVKADLNIVQTVLRNLINNAIKYSYSGGNITVSNAVEVNNFNNSENYIITVKDNGVGIPKNKIEKIFNVDEDVTTLGTASEKGTGLGLILCKELLEKNGSEIWVRSVEGNLPAGRQGGSEFCFTLNR